MSKRKPKPDPVAARVAAGSSEASSEAHAGIDIRTIASRKQEPLRRPALAARRKTIADVPAVQRPLFDLDQGGAQK